MRRAPAARIAAPASAPLAGGVDIRQTGAPLSAKKLAPPLDRIHRELKRAFDPAGVLNPGRLYPGL